jgi:hypothetical protein
MGACVCDDGWTTLPAHAPYPTTACSVQLGEGECGSGELVVVDDKGFVACTCAPGFVDVNVVRPRIVPAANNPSGQCVQPSRLVVVPFSVLESRVVEAPRDCQPSTLPYTGARHGSVNWSRRDYTVDRYQEATGGRDSSDARLMMMMIEIPDPSHSNNTLVLGAPPTSLAAGFPHDNRTGESVLFYQITETGALATPVPTVWVPTGPSPAEEVIGRADWVIGGACGEGLVCLQIQQHFHDADVHQSRSRIRHPSRGAVHDPSSRGIHESSSGMHESSSGMHESSSGMHESSSGMHESSSGLEIASDLVWISDDAGCLLPRQAWPVPRETQAMPGARARQALPAARAMTPMAIFAVERLLRHRQPDDSMAEATVDALGAWADQYTASRTRPMEQRIPPDRDLIVDGSACGGCGVLGPAPLSRCRTETRHGGQARCACPVGYSGPMCGIWMQSNLTNHVSVMQIAPSSPRPGKLFDRLPRGAWIDPRHGASSLGGANPSPPIVLHVRCPYGLAYTARNPRQPILDGGVCVGGCGGCLHGEICGGTGMCVQRETRRPTPASLQTIQQRWATSPNPFVDNKLPDTIGLSMVGPSMVGLSMGDPGMDGPGLGGAPASAGSLANGFPGVLVVLASSGRVLASRKYTDPAAQAGLGMYGATPYLAPVAAVPNPVDRSRWLAVTRYSSNPSALLCRIMDLPPVLRDHASTPYPHRMLDSGPGELLIGFVAHFPRDALVDFMDPTLGTPPPTATPPVPRGEWHSTTPDSPLVRARRIIVRSGQAIPSVVTLEAMDRVYGVEALVTAWASSVNSTSVHEKHLTSLRSSTLKYRAVAARITAVYGAMHAELQDGSADLRDGSVANGITVGQLTFATQPATAWAFFTLGDLWRAGDRSGLLPLAGIVNGFVIVTHNSRGDWGLLRESSVSVGALELALVPASIGRTPRARLEVIVSAFGPSVVFWGRTGPDPGRSAARDSAVCVKNHRQRYDEDFGVWASGVQVQCFD